MKARGFRFGTIGFFGSRSSALIVILCSLARVATPDPLSTVEGGVFGNLATPYFNYLDDLFLHLERAGGNVSEKCRSDTSQLVRLAREGNSAALTIFDSSGKPSSGVLQGGVYFIGSYSECVHAVVNTDQTQILGHYCLVNLNVSTSPQHEVLPQASWLVLSQTSKPPTIGICIPRSCSKEDAQYAANASSYDNFEETNANVAVCHTDLTGFDKDVGAIITFCVFLLFLLTALVATTFDFVIEHRRFQVILSKDKTVSTTELCMDEEKKSSSPPSVWIQCLLAFSFKTNARKIFTVGKGDNIGVVHGLRFLSMALIILGHTFSFATQNLYFRNPGAAQDAPKDFVSQIFANGTLAVDTFYLISGILVCYVTLKAMDKTNGKLPLLYFYFHRYFRLTPLLGAVIVFCAYLLRYVSNGPNWLASIVYYDVWCKNNGWLNILYLHNFINTENMCLSHSWYLATDMQMYLVAPLILIPLYKNLKYGLASMSIFLLATVVATAVITAVNHYPAIPYISNIVPLDVVNAYYKNVYIKPYCRIGPYIVGMAVGYYLLHNKELILRKRTVMGVWTLSVGLGLAVIYLMWPANRGVLPTNAEAAAYSSLARSLWAVSLAWLVVACFYGYGGFVSGILCWRPLVPFSRLTYCAYLIHPVVMNVYYGSTESAIVFSNSFILYTFLGNLCITYVLSIFLSMLFESPFVALEKAILTKKMA